MARKGNKFQAPLGALDLRPAQVSLVPLCLSSCIPKTIDCVCVWGGGGGAVRVWYTMISLPQHCLHNCQGLWAR